MRKEEIILGPILKLLGLERNNKVKTKAEGYMRLLDIRCPQGLGRAGAVRCDYLFVIVLMKITSRVLMPVNT